jgi:hypothetical protein
LDDFRENKKSNAGLSIDQLIRLTNFLKARGVDFRTKNPSV